MPRSLLIFVAVKDQEIVRHACLYFDIIIKQPNSKGQNKLPNTSTDGTSKVQAEDKFNISDAKGLNSSEVQEKQKVVWAQRGCGETNKLRFGFCEKVLGFSGLDA